MQSYTTQRNPKAFPDPERFNPERWLSDSLTDEAKELFMPYSKGPRVCLGKNLAQMELKLVTAAILVQDGWKVKQAPQTTDESMTMKDHFLAVPKAGRCDLIFERVGKK